MADIGPVAWGFIIAGGVLIGLLVGYLIGSRLGGKKSTAVREAEKQHDDYKHEVREHFEQTSQIMSRMVDDYREMYQHLSSGAGKLANIHPERVITPPPSPEAITAEPEPETEHRSDADEPPAREKRDEEADPAKPVSTGSLAEDEASAPKAKPEPQTRKAPPTSSADRDEDTAEKPASASKQETPEEKAPGEDDDKETEKERARRLSGEAPLPRRTKKSGGI